MAASSKASTAAKLLDKQMQSVSSRPAWSLRAIGRKGDEKAGVHDEGKKYWIVEMARRMGIEAKGERRSSFALSHDLKRGTRGNRLPCLLSLEIELYTPIRHGAAPALFYSNDPFDTPR